MRYAFNNVVNLLNRVQRRLARSRPGSVLILVVVLIVMLALMGTAFLSTTRNDRYTSAQNTANTQIDLLVDGVKEMAKSVIVGDLNGTYNGGTLSTYRPPLDTSQGTLSTNTYGSWDAPDVSTGTLSGSFPPQNEKWLSLRLPQVENEATPAVANVPPSGNQPYWAAIAAPVLSGATFDSPGVFGTATGGAAAAGVGTAYIQRINTAAAPLSFSPTSVTVNGKAYPAWFLPPPAGGASNYYIAADADGDGIADSGLFKLPVGQIDGVTYYAAVRIVDNNSAINVNTAYSRSWDFDFTGNPADPLGNSTATFLDNLGWFQSHVGLYESLRRTAAPNVPLTAATWNDANTTNEILAVNRYRFGYPTNTALNASSLSGSNTMVTDGTTPAAYAEANFATQGDMLQNQLARRLSNPGYIDPTAGGTPQQCRAFSLSDAASLAYHFTLVNPSGSMSTLESTFFGANPAASFADSVYRSAANYSGTGQSGSIPGRSAYTPSAVDNWYNENFGLAGTVSIPTRWPNVRSIFTTYSTTSNLIQPKPIPTPPATLLNEPMPNAGMTPYRATPAKTSLNTTADPTGAVNLANFGELWRAFWCVMSENLNTTGTPFTPDVAPTSQGDIYRGEEFSNTFPIGIAGAQMHPQEMFRSSIREIHNSPGTFTYFTGANELLLRAAIAATQAMQLREQGILPVATTPVAQQIQLPAFVNGTSQTVTATVFGNQPQPFITEVYAQTDTANMEGGLGPNPDGYVAIELYNPYPQTITLDNTYDIVAVQKTGSAQPTYPLPAATPVYTFPAAPGVTIGPDSFIVIDNYTSDALYVPASANLIGTASLHAPLHLALNQELVIRHKITSGALTLECPIDSFDFTGLLQGNLNANIANLWHYVRPAGGTNRWKCVYPGRYNATFAVARQEGTDQATSASGPVTIFGWDQTTTSDPWKTGVPAGHVAMSLGAANGAATYPNTFTIQLANQNWPGANSLTASNNLFPFGGFARNGDMLQIPFIGAYTIDTDNDVTNGFIEMNSISMDAAFAEDTDTTDDEPEQGTSDTGAQPREQIGRFCPIHSDTTNFPGVDVDDFGTDPTKYRYAWAKKLFDYLTVQAPQDDYLPNVNPTQANNAGIPQPQSVDNDGDGQANANTSVAPPTDAEDSYPLQGLININTAPWRVLAALPMLPTGDANKLDYSVVSGVSTGTWTAGTVNNIDDNTELAQAIVKWRDGDPTTGATPQGPFKSIFDLYNVPAFRDAQQKLIIAKGDPGSAHGDFSPVIGNDGVRYDFEEQYLLMNKISNLITTRSDSFTVYVLVQGWRGVGTSNPTLVVQRRAAFIQDRSAVTQTNTRLPAAVNVPND